jgi:autotransporter adhesin
LSNTSGGFAAGVQYIGGVAYSVTNTPDIATSNLNFYLQGQPTFLTSTHQIFTTASTLVLNNTVFIDDTNNSVGINNGVPGGPTGYTLNVNGSIGASSITVGGALAVNATGLTSSRSRALGP